MTFHRALSPRRLTLHAGAAVALGIGTTVLLAWLGMVSGLFRSTRAANGAAVRGGTLVEVQETSRALVRFRFWALRSLEGDGPIAESARRTAKRVQDMGGHAYQSEAARQGAELARSFGQRVRDPLPTTFPADDLAARGPPISLAPPDLGANGVSIGEYASGWPLRALWMYGVIRYEITTDPLTGRPDVQTRTVWSGSWRPYSGGGARGAESAAGRLPLLPMWPGLLLNTGLFSLPWFGLITSPGVIRHRRRRRRGRGPRCAYDLRRDLTSGCPECGWNRISPHARE